MITTVQNMRDIITFPATITDDQIIQSILFSENYILDILGTFEEETITEYYDYIYDAEIVLSKYLNIKDGILSMLDIQNGVYNVIESKDYKIGFAGILTIYNPIYIYAVTSYKDKFKMEYKVGYTTLNDSQLFLISEMVNMYIIHNTAGTNNKEVLKEKVHGKFEITYASSNSSSANIYQKISTFDTQIKKIFK